MKEIVISKEESDKVAELFYGYNALLDLAKSVESDSPLYQNLIIKIKHEKYLLEMAKSEVVKKYIKDTNDEVNYKFDFNSNTLCYDD